MATLDVALQGICSGTAKARAGDRFCGVIYSARDGELRGGPSAGSVSSFIVELGDPSGLHDAPLSTIRRVYEMFCVMS